MSVYRRISDPVQSNAECTLTTQDGRTTDPGRTTEIGASLMQDIAAALEVPAMFFFEGLALALGHEA